MKIPTWIQLHPFLPVYGILILLVGVYIICLPRISRKANEGGQRKYSLRTRMFVIFASFIAINEIIQLVIGLFRGPPSQVQLENELKMSTENGLKYQAWQISHPYAVPLLIFILVVVAFIISVSRIYWKMKEGKNPLLNFGLYFCIATVMIIGALIISFFRGK
jgi:hypothetical protein